MLIRHNTKLCGIPHYIASKLIRISTTSLPDHDRGRRPSRDKRRNRRSSSFNSMLSLKQIPLIMLKISFQKEMEEHLPKKKKRLHLNQS